MLLQAVTHPSRVHLDIESDDVEAEVERLEALGARRLEKIHTWWVLEAPTGHRFCVVRPQRGPLGEGANVWPSTTPPRVPTSKDEVAAAADAFSAAWRSGRLEALEGLVDPEVVFVQPGGSSRIEGRAACIDSFRGFLAAATIERYQEGDRQIDVNGNTAVVTYRWTMAWRRAGQDHRESGRDLLVLGRRDGRWRITWRTLLPS
jgi:ketosteroid isomerase-like protein